MRNLDKKEIEELSDLVNENEVDSVKYQLEIKKLMRKYRVSGEVHINPETLFFCYLSKDENGSVQEKEISSVPVTRDELLFIVDLKDILELSNLSLQEYVMRKKKECSVPSFFSLSRDFLWVPITNNVNPVKEEPLETKKEIKYIEKL